MSRGLAGIRARERANASSVSLRLVPKIVRFPGAECNGPSRAYLLKAQLDKQLLGTIRAAQAGK